jgi:hypothetical protein
MLSQKFKTAIYQLLEEKEKAVHYDRSHTNCNYDMAYACQNIISIFRELSNSSQILGTDQNTYDNNIGNGILNSMNNVDHCRKTNICDAHIRQLLYLDDMKEENQHAINEYLESLDPNYILDKNIYEKIKDKQTPFIFEWRILATMWEYPLLKTHFNIMIRKIYFVWCMDKMLYIPDIMKYIEYAKKINQQSNLVPNQPFISFSCIISYISSSQTKYDDVYELFQFMELLIKKYKSIDIFKTSHMHIAQPSGLLLKKTLLSQYDTMKKIKDYMTTTYKITDSTIMNNIVNIAKKRINNRQNNKSIDLLFQKELIDTLNANETNNYVYYSRMLEMVLIALDDDWNDSTISILFKSMINNTMYDYLKSDKPLREYDESKLLYELAGFVRNSFDSNTLDQMNKIVDIVTPIVVNYVADFIANSTKPRIKPFGSVRSDGVYTRIDQVRSGGRYNGFASVSNILAIGAPVIYTIDIRMHTELLKYICAQSRDHLEHINEIKLLMLDQNWKELIQSRLNMKLENTKINYKLCLSKFYNGMINNETYEIMKRSIVPHSEVKKQNEVIIKSVITKNELDNLKVTGLKEYCVKLNLNTTKCKLRIDYINLLMPFVNH